MKFPDFLNRLKFEEVSKGNKLILIALLSALMLYLDFSLIIKLQLKVIKSVSEKAAKISKELSTFTKESAVVEELKKHPPAVGKGEKALKAQKAIKDEELPLLLQDISDMAKKNNVKITQVKPSKEISQKGEVISGKKLSPLILTLNLSCGYHSLGSFINQLENSAYFLAVEEIKIRQGSSDFALQDVNLSLKTYVKK